MAAIFKRTRTTADGGVISISYSILGLGILLLTIIMGAMLMLDHYFVWCIALKEYISMGTFGCVTIGLIYNAAALQLNYELNRQKFETDAQDNQGKKVQITYEAVSEWYKTDMATNFEVTRKLMQPYKGKLNDPGILADFKWQLDLKNNMNTRKSLTAVLNYFEHLSLLCADNVIDEEMLKKTFRTAFITYYTNLKEFIEDEQRGNAGANSRIYINFADITKKWMYT
ncbi:MAG TPA: DUF4760 domain-containing protein [Puia sp.]|nr:DUF4760 domain-containing protein [Puia sp.]